MAASGYSCFVTVCLYFCFYAVAEHLEVSTNAFLKSPNYRRYPGLLVSQKECGELKWQSIGCLSCYDFRTRPLNWYKSYFSVVIVNPW